MAENAGPSTEEVAEDEEDNYNYYECKYSFFALISFETIYRRQCER